MKGVILEIKGNKAVVLSKDGDFKVIKLKSKCFYNVGDEIEVEREGMFYYTRSLALYAAVFLIFSIIAFSIYYNMMIPVMYVSIDINPSLEFEVNRLERVIDVNFYNEDGANIVGDKKAFKNKTLEEAVKLVINKAKENKYMEGEKPAVMFTISYKDNAKINEKIKETLKNAVKEAVQKDRDSSPGLKAADAQESENVDVIIEEISIQKHNDAKKIGISPGKLYIYEKMKEKKPDISLEEVKKQSIKNLLKGMTNNQVKELINNRENSNNLNTDKDNVKVKENQGNIEKQKETKEIKRFIQENRNSKEEKKKDYQEKDQKNEQKNEQKSDQENKRSNEVNKRMNYKEKINDNDKIGEEKREKKSVLKDLKGSTKK